LGGKLELGDLTRFVSVSDPQLSPDGEKVAFVATSLDDERDEYASTIWVIGFADGEPLQFMSGKKDRSPVWSPDGKQIIFTSQRGLEEGEKGSELWVATVRGGEPRLLVRMKGGVTQPRWSPDGSKAFFLSGVGEPEKDVKVVDRIPLWSNGVGFTYNLRSHVHVADVASGNVKALTEGDFNVVCYAPSNDGERIAYAASADDLAPIEMEVRTLDLASKESSTVTDGFMVMSLCWSPDDEHIAFMGSDRSKGFATHVGVWVLPSGGGEPENLTKELGRGISRRAYHDLRSSAAEVPAPIWEGGKIYFPLSEGRRFNLYCMDFEDRSIKPVVAGDFSLEEYSVRGGVVAFTRVRGSEPVELWTSDGRGARRLTGFNDDLLSDVALIEPETFEFQASDGATIDGWMIKPHGLEAGGKCPAILDIHGGPKSKFGHSVMFEHQLYAALGYAVLYFNPRGSDGYTEEFADIRGRYGTRDYQDIMEAVDSALERYDFIDRGRLGVTGLSYGGFMTNWIVTQTDRFRAAISQNGISHWPSFYGTSDIGFYFSPDQVDGDPWASWELYREKSPLTHAREVSTPVLFIHSYEDYRCWIDQSIIFFTALKHLGKEARLVLFMEGAHTFRSTARPSIRKKRYKHMLDWFDSHLKGEVTRPS
jgi:dipeptidyl aminopeptidase/acylaminoacyl peptidase